MIKEAVWITPERDMGELCPVFVKSFYSPTKIDFARLYIASNGAYKAVFNNKNLLRRGQAVRAELGKYQSYDLTLLASKLNTLEITVDMGLHDERTCSEEKDTKAEPPMIIAAIKVEYMNGDTRVYLTDKSWSVKESPIHLSELCENKPYDASFKPAEDIGVIELTDMAKDALVYHEGEIL